RAVAHRWRGRLGRRLAGLGPRRRLVDPTLLGVLDVRLAAARRRDQRDGDREHGEPDRGRSAHHPRLAAKRSWTGRTSRPHTAPAKAGTFSTMSLNTSRALVHTTFAPVAVASRTAASHAGTAWPGGGNAGCIRWTRP